VEDWLAKHPRYHLHFTPTSSSWLNLVERWFGAVTNKAIRRGVFHSVPEPKPFVWTATADAAPVGGPISLPDRPVSEHAAHSLLIDAGVPVETARWRGRPGRS